MLRILLVFSCMFYFLMFTANSEAKTEVHIVEPICTTYCNDRFVYCVDYPENYFDTAKLPDNGGGMILINTDNQQRLVLNGSYNIFDLEAEDLINRYIQELRVKNLDTVNILELENIPNGMSIIVQVGGTYHAVKYMLSEDSYMMAALSVPRFQEDLFYQLRNDLDIYLMEEDTP